jgi:F-type H+-transporting ATPase subunit a
VQSPLNQFLIKEIIPLHIGSVDVSLSNSSMFMILVSVSLIVFQYWALRKATLVPNRLQSVLEASYDFIAGIIDDNIGKEGRVYAPFIFTLFMFILFANLLGMIPYSFTVTSHVAVTFTLAIFFFLAITILGFYKHGLKYLKLFFPEGAPWILAPLLVPLELVAYLVRPITLALRLFLNMTAGHIMLKVFAGFSVMLGATYAIFPVLFNILFIGFEFFVAGLQAYIFTILICIYLNDAVHLH